MSKAAQRAPAFTHPPFPLRARLRRTISALSRSVIQWAEDDYNHQIHGTLQLKPIDRYSLDLRRIHFIQPNPFNEDEARQRGDGASPRRG